MGLRAAGEAGHCAVPPTPPRPTLTQSGHELGKPAAILTQMKHTTAEIYQRIFEGGAQDRDTELNRPGGYRCWIQEASVSYESSQYQDSTKL